MYPIPSPAQPITESTAVTRPGGAARGLVDLTAAQREAARLHVAGRKAKDIASELGVVPATVSGWLRQPLVREYVRVLEAIRERGAAALYDHLVQNHLLDAAITELGIMGNDQARDRDRINAAQDIMDRGGLPKISRTQADRRSQVITINLTDAQAKALAAPMPAIEPLEVEVLPPEGA